MFRSNLKMAWRSLLKNKTSSIINLAGLAIGLATAILIMLVVKQEFEYDQFHTNLKDIHILMKNEKQGLDVSTSSVVPGPLAADVRSQVPEAEFVSRVSFPDAQLIQYEDKTIYESGIYAEPEFFQILKFPVLYGDPVVAMKDPSSVVISETMAKKIFGVVDAIGKSFTHNKIHALKVGAVIKDIPQASTRKFSLVLPFSLYENENDWLKKWDDNRIETYILAVKNVNISTLNSKLSSLFQKRTENTGSSLFAYPLAKLHLHGDFKNGKPNGGKIYIVLLLSVIGLFVLLIACINFINLSTAKSEHRAREVGVRKVMGASRRTVAVQFFCEALLISFLSLLAGVILAKLLLPAFNQVMHGEYQFVLSEWQTWVLLLTIGLVTGIIAGIYPALFLSRFNMVKVLKGVTSSGKATGLLRKSLVSFQFMISIFFIFGTIVIITQINHIKNRPLGYQQANLLAISARTEVPNKLEVFRNTLDGMPGIKSITAGSDNLLRFGGGINGLEWPGKQEGQDFPFSATWVSYNWTKTSGLQMAQGRDFNPEFGTDTSACLINQTAVLKMGLKDPIGLKIGDKTIIGVVRDFVFNNPSGNIAPMIVFLSKGSLGNFLVRIDNNIDSRKTIANIEKAMKKIDPNYPFEYSFLEESYHERFEEINSLGLLSSIFGGMAIFISCLGLFGLSAFLAEKKGKEMSIRKVLGASIHSVWFSLSKDFLKPVLIAFALALPISVWVMNQFLGNIGYRVELSWWMFALAAFVALFIAVFTISFEAIKAATANPIKRLRSE